MDISLWMSQLIAGNLNLINTGTFSSLGPDKAGGSLIVKQLRRLFQFCFDNSFVPLQWRTAYITLVFKKRNRKNPGNYRPFSLTCCIRKLMKACVRETIWKFWTDRSLIIQHNLVLFKIPYVLINF